MQPSRQARSASSREETASEDSEESLSGLGVDLVEIERSAHVALAAVEVVLDQAKAARHALAQVLSEVGEMSVNLAEKSPPPLAINHSTLSEGARLLATQMAASGASRGEVEGRLRDQFAIEDLGDLLDWIYEAPR
jgi:hypothetical protein